MVPAFSRRGPTLFTSSTGHFALNAATLETEGPAPINALRKGQVQLSPMPRVDPLRNRLVAYSNKPGVLGSDEVTFHEYDPEWNEVRKAPAINPQRTGQPHRFGYVASPVTHGDEPVHQGYFWFHGLAEVDFEQGNHQRWSAGPRAFCSPPAFVPRPGASGEDEGWLLSWVLDAQKLAEGPLVRLGLKDLLPAVSHTEFAA